jgi:hypothetical protein
MLDQTVLPLPSNLQAKVFDFVNKEGWKRIKVLAKENTAPGSLLIQKLLDTAQIDKDTWILYGHKIIAKLKWKFTIKRNTIVSDMKTCFVGTFVQISTSHSFSATLTPFLLIATLHALPLFLFKRHYKTGACG